MITFNKKSLRDLSIKYKYIIGISTILIISIPLLSIVFINQSGNLLQEALIDKVRLLNGNFSIISSNALQENSFSFLQQLIKEVASKDKELVELIIAYPDGTVTATSDEKKYMQFSVLDSPKMLKLFKDRKDRIFQNYEDSLIESIRFIYAEKITSALFGTKEPPQKNIENDVKIKLDQNPDNLLIDREIVGVIYLSVTTKFMQGSVHNLWIFSGIFTIFLLIIGIIAGYITGLRISSPIAHLANSVREIASGNLDVSIYSGSKDEIGNLVSDVESMRISIKDLTENLEAKVKKRTIQLQDANEKLSEAMEEIWGGMELAKKIQTVLLPQQPNINGYEISAYMEPADEVGGDYYDIINVDSLDWIVIGDVSGHGIPAGLIMMMVQTSIRVTLNLHPDIDPSKLLSIINKTISYNIKQMGDDKYMTITVLAAHQDGKFVFSGLHQDILIYDAETCKVKQIETNGIWLGIIDDIEGMNHNRDIAMKPGDIMLIYTDGITEAWNKNTIRDQRDPIKEMFGNARLMNTLASLGDYSTNTIKDGILKKLDSYKCDDDITMVILKRIV